MDTIDRRSFLEHSCVGASLTAFLAMADMAARAQEQAGFLKPQPPLKKKYRAAAIGSTGRGDFGHGLDTALVRLPGVEFVAIADDNPAGLKEAGKRCGVRAALHRLSPDVGYGTDRFGHHRHAPRRQA